MENNEIKQISKLSWIINNSCNLNCIHCYPDSGLGYKQLLSKDDFSQIFNNFKGMHFHRTFLSGGEPILDNNFYEYLEIAKHISDEVFLCSNGTLLTESKLNELIDKGINGIVVSCQTIDPKLAFNIYGNEKVPNLVFAAIKRIQNLNISFSVEISLMKQNVPYLDDIIEKLISLGVTTLSFKRLLPVGRGNSDQIALSKKENYDILTKIYNWQETHENIRFNVHDPLYGTILFDHLGNFSNNVSMQKWLRGFSCRAGTRWIGIDPAGNVSPCPILLYKDTIIGNIIDAPLIDIINNSVLMNLFQKIEEENANSCKYGNVCLGCRATAIAKNENLFSKDPMCIYKNEMCPIATIKREEK